MSTIMVDDKSAVPHHNRLSMDPQHCMTMLSCIAESEIKVIHTYIHTNGNCDIFRCGQSMQSTNKPRPPVPSSMDVCDLGGGSGPPRLHTWGC